MSPHPLSDIELARYREALNGSDMASAAWPTLTMARRLLVAVDARAARIAVVEEQARQALDRAEKAEAQCAALRTAALAFRDGIELQNSHDNHAALVAFNRVVHDINAGRDFIHINKVREIAERSYHEGLSDRVDLNNEPPAPDLSAIIEHKMRGGK